MARCAVAGCDRPLGWRGKRLSRDATYLDTFFPALEDLRNRARHEHDECRERELRWTIGIGRGYRWHLHEAAHGDGFARLLVPTESELQDWRAEATSTSQKLETLDQG